MSLIELVLFIALVGLAVWLVQKFIPMGEPFKTAINIVCGIFVLFLILNVVFDIGPKVKLFPDGWRGGSGHPK
jgi:hypothetical protein